ncbi:hypothetical protein SMC26_28980 [Actinomadura fulvescens]
MTNLVDLSEWPLVRAQQNGRLTVEQATELNAAMVAMLTRAKAEGVRVAIIVDQHDRQAPQKGALEIVHSFWAEREAEIAERCCGYASIVATQELADLVQNPGPGGLVVMGTVDPQAAETWAKERLAAEDH